ncbi:MAG TPA: redoxin domain-containing protein [Fimbriimonas sp.]|nr:redoxin domain-containing protein [Fimbriimonas sp.]
MLDLPAKPIQLSAAKTPAGTVIKYQVSQAKLTTLLIISTECPIANRYAPEMSRIYKDYSSKGVKFFRVYVAGSAGEINKHGLEYKLGMTAILDSKKDLVGQVGAKVTPEAVVMDRVGKVVYRGRIDDRNVEHGVERPDYRRDLRIALDEALAGKKVSLPEAPAIGCFL